MVKRLLNHARWRFCMWRWRNAPFTFTGTEVWPDEEPMLPTSRAVKSHSIYYRFWTPWAAWRAAREWENEPWGSS